MATYGSFLYGSGQLYGTDDAVEYLDWSFSVFWDDAFVDEAARMIDLQAIRGRDHLLATGGGWERFRPGEVSALFDNSDGRYDPFNTSSPLYGFLLPGRVVRIAVAVTPPFLPDTTTFQVMRGIITDIQSFLRGGQRTARIIVKDGLEWLTRRSATLALAEDDEAMDTAAAIATGVGFDAVDDWSVAVLGTDSVVLPLAWGSSNNALEMINELCDTEIGQVVHLADGTLALICGDYTEAQSTDLDEDYLLRDLEVRQPWEVVRTRAQITVNPYEAGASQVLWTFGNSGQVAAWTAATVPAPGSSPYLIAGPVPASPGVGNYQIVTDAIFSTGGAFTAPTVSYDVLHERTGFTWDDASADAFITFSSLDIGTGLRLTWVNAHSYVGVTNYMAVPWIEITASPYEPADPVIINSEDAAAIAIYGEKTFTLDSQFMQDSAYAQAYADFIVSELGAAHIFPTIQLEGRGLLQFGQELFTSKINLTIPALGIDATFRVGKISHRWLNQNGFSVRTELKLEPVLTAWNGAA